MKRGKRGFHLLKIEFYGETLLIQYSAFVGSHWQAGASHRIRTYLVVTPEVSIPGNMFTFWAGTTGQSWWMNISRLFKIHRTLGIVWLLVLEAN